jgi:C1A family cysteine protease
MAKKKFLYGWKPDLPDQRDHIYSAPLAKLKALPPKVDLRSKFPPPYDQAEIGSCTANAIAAAIQFDRRFNKMKPDFTPSRLFIYYNERAMEHTVASDAGAEIRDGIKSIAKQGVCPESLWPYSPVPADPKTDLFPPGAPETKRPPKKCYDAAKNYQAIAYQRLTNSLSQLKGCLAEGFPFVFGFTVYSSLYDSKGNPRARIPLPSAKDGVEGGHAVLAVGYDDKETVFIVRNSWGSDVQDKGYFYIPYAYVTDTNLADDIWTIRSMES